MVTLKAMVFFFFFKLGITFQLGPKNLDFFFRATLARIYLPIKARRGEV